MSEHLLEHVEHDPNQVEHHDIKPQPETSPNHFDKSEPPDLVELRSNVEHQAISADEVSVGEKDTKSQPTSVNRDMKNNAYTKSLQQIRSKLTGADKFGSRIIHQPMLEKLSNWGAQTVARPAGLIGGGTAALLGSLTLLIMTKRNGFSYNYLLIFAFFVIGFIAGLLIELITRLIRPHRPQI